MRTKQLLRCLRLLLFASLTTTLSLPAHAPVARSQESIVNVPWTPLGPTSATIFALAREPFNPRVVYAGTYFGGVYKSTDSGLTWTHLQSDFSTAVIFSIATDPNRANTLYVGTFEFGLHKSEDSGASWVRLTNGLTDNTVQDVAVDPLDSNTVLAATASGVFRSTDGGVRWTLASRGLEFRGKTLLFDPHRPGLVYVGTLDRGVFRSTDGGVSWEPFTNGLTNPVVNSLDADDQSTEAIYASTLGGLFRLRRDATTWEDVTFNLPTATVNQVMVRPQDQGLLAATDVGVYRLREALTPQWELWSQLPGRVLMTDPSGTLIHVAATYGALRATSDDGATLFPVEQGMQNLFAGALATVTLLGKSFIYTGSDRGIFYTSDLLQGGDRLVWFHAANFNQGVFSVAPHPSQPGVLFAGTELAGVWKSSNYGNTWTPSTDGIVPTKIFSIAQAPVGSQTLYVGTSTGIYISRDHGQTWALGTTVAVPTYITAVAADPVRPAEAYFGTTAGEVYKTVDNGFTFKWISQGLPSERIIHIVSAPPGNLYAVTAGGGLYVFDRLTEEWRLTNAGIEQGVLTVAINPQQMAVAYAGTSGGGVYKTTSNGARWQQKSQGIDVPFIFALAVDPNAPQTVYAGAVGKVYRSTDGAETWAEMRSGLPDGFVASLIIDPTASQTLYASVQDQGIYKSTDGGVTWHELRRGKPFVGNLPIALSPGDAQTLFVGTSLEGMYRSADGGATWERSNKGMTLFVRSIAINPHNPDIMYAGSLGGGLFKSTDGGQTWINKGLDDRNLFNVALDPQNPDTIYLATTVSIVRSTDGGETWTTLGQQAAFLFDVVADPRDRRTVYVSGNQGALFKSTDSGQTWQAANTGLPEVLILALAIDPHTGTLYASADRAGVYKSLDGGASWQRTSASLIGPAQITSLTVDPVTGDVYAASNGFGIFKTTNAGDTWAPLFTGFASHQVSSVVVDPFDHTTVFASTLGDTGNDPALYVSTDAGQTWRAAATGLISTGVRHIAASPHLRGVLLAAAAEGVFKSTDGGAVWQLSSRGLEGIEVTRLLFDATDPQVVYAGAFGPDFFRSTDAGATWSHVDSGREALDVRALAYGPDRTTLYAATFGNGLAKTTNGAETWDGGIDPVLINPLGLFLVIDPQTPSTIYAATSGLGVIKSTDRGLTWRQINHGLDNLFLLALAIDPVEPQTLYAGTTGSGVFVTENGGDSWMPMNLGLFNKVVTALVVDPIHHRIVYVGTEGGGVFSNDRSWPSVDSDSDGVFDNEDCAPSDPRIASLHIYYGDADLDHFGNPAQAVPSCSPTPGPFLVAWNNDPSDANPFVFPSVIPKGNRLFGVDFSYLAEDGNFTSERVLELGVDATTLELLWGDLERTPGAFDGPQAAALQVANTVYAANKLKVSLTISPISSVFLSMPDDLRAGMLAKTIRFNDPAVIERFKNLLTFVHAQLADVELVSLQIGYEIDLFVRQETDGQFWLDYTEFYQAVYYHAKSLWGGNLPVSATWTVDGRLNPGLKWLRFLLDSVSDIISVTYFPRNHDFTVIEPSHIAAQLALLVEQTVPKQLYFQAVGYPTAPITRSSVTKQSQFFRAFFDFWDLASATIPFVSFGPLHDISRSQAEALADTALYRNVDPTLRPRLVAYLASLGLRTYEGAGVRKTGYQTLRNLTFDRGWWRDIERTTRSFYLGFTPSPYDLPPDAETQAEVADWVKDHIRANADLIALHLDGGVPWVEAFHDNFASDALPYSDAVKGTFARHQSDIPAGHKLLVSINPLGVPRDLLAPYWGFGEGFEFDAHFNRVPNGTFADGPHRALPAPWNTFDFNDEPVKTAFLNYAKRVLRYFRPDYLLIGIEVSAALIEDPARYEKYLELHKFVYKHLKAIPEYSHIPIMVSFSATTYMVDEYGVAYKFDEQKPGVRERVLAEFAKFLPYTDIIGLSLYPHFGKYNAYTTPASIYDELFEMFTRFGAANKPIAITESGYTADVWDLSGHFVYNGSVEKQERFYKLLFRELARHSNPVEFVVGFQIRDGDIGWQRQSAGSQQELPAANPTFVEFYQFFRDIGIYDGNGNLRQSGETWLAQLNLPHVPRLAATDQVTIRSPNGQLSATFGVSLADELFYTLHFGDTPVLGASPLGITVDGIDLGKRITAVGSSNPVTVEDTYPTLGVHAVASMAYTTVTLTVRRDLPGDAAYEIDVRLYNDGLAYRYVVPGNGAREITGEASGWALPGGSRIWYQNDVFLYEGEYTSGLVGQIESGLGGLLTVQLPAGGYLVLTEADVDGYSGLTFVATNTGAHMLRAQFVNDVSWTVAGGSASPWRVTLVSADLNGLVNSDVLTSLNAAPDQGLFPNGPHTDWIRPGRGVWSNWSDSESNLDLNLQKQFVDAAAALGFEYSVVDLGWEFGFRHFGFANQFEALADLVHYAHSHGRDVDIIVGKLFTELQDADARQRFLQAIKQAGAAGVKIDFVSIESQKMHDFMTAVRQDAALYELLVWFNVAPKPTGDFRTYPHELTRDAVRGLEWNTFADDVTPEHNAALPFTRLIAGPAAYNPVTFAPAKLGSTTFAHQLATAGIFTSPLQIWAAHPANVVAQTEALDVIRTMPTVWEQTLVLPDSKIGERVVFARRRGDRWFLFVLNGDSAAGKTVENVDLTFLGDQQYHAVFLSDATPTSFARFEVANISSGFDLDVAMFPGGGFVGMFTPVPRTGGRFADLDNDGLADADDRAPLDSRLTSLHVYYFDLDGDQFGDPNNPLFLPSPTPFPGSVAWGNDPDDHNNAVIAPIGPKGNRLLGLDFADAAETGQWRADLARELGAEATTLVLMWSLLETTPGSFDGPQASLLQGIAFAYAAEGFKLNLTISPIAQTCLTLPSDLAAQLAAGALRLNDPQVLNRFKRLLDFVHDALPNVELVSLQLGHEVDLYFTVESNNQFWTDYADFFQHVSAHAKGLWGTELRVGVTATHTGLLHEPTRTRLQTLHTLSDIVSLTYLPQHEDFTAIAPSQVRKDIQQLFALYGPKPLSFQSVGYPSAPITRSSQTQQTQFLQAFFDAWDSYAESIPFVSFVRLHDYAPQRAATALQALPYRVPLEAVATATAYLESLGLRTFAAAGAHKSAYSTLRNLAFERGWWRVAPHASRSFLLGFTAFPYDHNPGGPLSDEVLDHLFATIASGADLVLYHFDKGVPWVEAFADTFASDALPYSQNLKEVWAKQRARRPPGATVAVAINPLGIPRHKLAPYWGVGEGFYHDKNFDRVGTGVVQDYEERLLPSPWDQYELNSAAVKTAFLNYARRTIEYFDPTYLIMGLEVNLALQASPEAFAKYLELHRYVYEQLRTNPAYDHVKIVVSFAAEYFMTDELGVPFLIDALQQEGLEARHLQALKDILPYTDLVGLSIYPIKSRFGTYLTPAAMFDQLFSKLRTVTDKPFAITETGYPATSFRVANLPFATDLQKQARFIRLLLAEVEKQGNVEFVTNFAVRDLVAHMDRLRARSRESPPFVSPDLVEFFQYFEHIGMYDVAGNPRPATQIWLDTLALPLSGIPAIKPVSIASPSGTVVATIDVDNAGRLYYTLRRDGITVLENSPLGITVDAIDLGSAVTNITASSPREVHETYPVRGAHRMATNHYHQVTLTIRRTGVGDAVYNMVFRLFDNGVAYRYVIPGVGNRVITGEASAWQIPQGSNVWFQTETDNYEGEYFRAAIGGFDNKIGGPFTVELPDGSGFVVLTEAGLVNYSGMTYDAALGSRLIRSTFLHDASWVVEGGSATPWRVAIVSADLNGLVNADIVSNLSAPPDPSLFPAGVNTAWIRPGRAVWSWWSDFFSGADFEAQRAYVDYAHTLGFEYAVVDVGWELGFPTQGKNQFERLAELVDYAHSDGRNVDVWVWKNWLELLSPEEQRTFFQAVHNAGAVGVKIDNGYGNASEAFRSVQLYEQLLRAAAEQELMVNFHGSNKGTGLARTYPNEITREGLKGLENTSLLWEFGVFGSPQHNAALPFVRFVTGPGDYTPVIFDPRKIGATTFTHQLATAGLYTSPLLHYAENPALLLAQTQVLDVLKAIPTEWDETVVVKASVIGELAGLARRTGERWFLFMINGNAVNGKTIKSLDLSFLGSGEYDATLIRDQTQTKFDRDEVLRIDSAYHLDVTMLPGGGFVAMFTPSPPPVVGQIAKDSRYKATYTTVYQENVESGPGGMRLTGLGAVLTTAPAEVIGGNASIRLAGQSSLTLPANVLNLRPFETYSIEYDYRILHPANPPGFTLPTPVIVEAVWDGGETPSVALGGPVDTISPIAGRDSRTIRIGNVSNATFVFRTLWAGEVVIDNIAIVRHGVELHAADVRLLTNGFPRLSNYMLESPLLNAITNGFPYQQILEVLGRFDLINGTSNETTLFNTRWVEQLRQVNPNLLILPYQQSFMAQFLDSERAVEYAAGLRSLFNLGLRQEWFVVDTAGHLLNEPRFPQNFQMNHTPFGVSTDGQTFNAYVAQFLSQYVLPSGLWDGIHFDQPEFYVNPLLSKDEFSGEFPPIDLDRDGVAETKRVLYHAWRDGFLDYFKRIQDTFGYSHLILGNAGYIPAAASILANLNGWQREIAMPYLIKPNGDWDTGATAEWYRLMRNYQIANASVRAPQIISIQFTGQFLGTPKGSTTPNGLPDRLPVLEHRDFQRMRLGLTTTLMGNGFFSYALVDNTSVPVWFDEYAVDANGVATSARSGKGYLGQPLGPGRELPYPSREVFNLDFESDQLPPGMVLGANLRISTNRDAVIAGGRSLVATNPWGDNLGLILTVSDPAVPLEVGKTYEVFMDFKILDYDPVTYRGLPLIGFSDTLGGLSAVQVASNIYADFDGPGQTGTLRSSLRIREGGTTVLAALQDVGTVAVDNIRLVEATGGVWRRDFEHGIVLVNPTPEAIFVSQQEVVGTLHRTNVRRIIGSQDPQWNNGVPVTDGLWLPSGDGIILLADLIAAPPPATPHGLSAKVKQRQVTLTWQPATGTAAGYLIRYAEGANDFTEFAIVGAQPTLVLDTLSPGTRYTFKVAAYDFLGHISAFSQPLAVVTPGLDTAKPQIIADGDPVVLTPGGTATLKVANLPPDTRGVATGPYPTELASTSVRINGTPAPVVAVSPQKITFVVPASISGVRAIVRVVHNGRISAGQSLPLREAPTVVPERSFRLGFTSQPPANSNNGYMAAYAVLRDHADLVAHSFQQGIPWPEALVSSDPLTYSRNLQAQWELLRSANTAVIPRHDRYLMINPIATSYEGLAPYWGEQPNMPLPSPWDQYEFNHPNVKAALVNYLMAAIEFFQPTYLAINVEANILLAKRPWRWQAFKELNAHVYTAIKARYPELTVFSTIHYEHLLGLHTDSAVLAAQLKDSYPNVLENEVRALLRHSDLLALSTYPYMVANNVVTTDYYSRAYALAEELNKPIAIDQTGYPTRDLFFEPLTVPLPGSDELQDNFLAFLLQEALDHNFAFVVNFMSVDYGTTFGTNWLLTWAYTGLMNEDGTPKPALAAWDAFFHLPYKEARSRALQIVGNVESTMVGNDVVDFVLQQGVVARVELLDSTVLRVRINPQGVFTDLQSGAIAPTGLSAPGSAIVDTSVATYLTTRDMSVIVNKSPFQVVVLRPDGSLITADQERGIGWHPGSGLIFNRKVAPVDEEYFGLGLRGGPLRRRGGLFIMRNSDNGAYGEFTGPLYSSTPFYYGARDGMYYGVFLDNPAQAFFDMDSKGDGSVTFGAQQGELDYYVFTGPTPVDVAQAFASLTGFAPLPARWTLGFHQSRFGYQSWDEILDLARVFRALRIPADAFYLDLDYMDRLRLFTWDPVNFADPIANYQALADLGFRCVNIIDPAVRTDDPLWPFLAASGFFLQDINAQPLVNTIFLGDVSWLDFTRPQTARWYVDQLKAFLQTGPSGVWNDLNEPAQNLMPEAIYDFGGQRRTDVEARNLYALRETSLTYQALLELRPDERPFVLSRSGYPGIQRYAANWSGDTLSTFDSLRVSVQISLHMALSGQVQFGHDVGGFLNSPSPELFIRWLQFSSLTPFFRNHALHTTEPREPWQFGEPYTTIARTVINQRYQLMPYLYTLFEQASRTGEPVLAPTFFHFPDDPQTYMQDQEFMLGPFLLVAPVVEAGATTRTVYLPAGGDWIDWHTGQGYSGGEQVIVAAPLERIPIFVRQGSLLPTGPVMQYVDEPVPPRMHVDIYPGGNEQFTLYEDDGSSFDYQQGDYLRTRITSVQTAASRALTIEPVEGSRVAPERPWWLYFHGLVTPPLGVSLNGTPLPSAATEAGLDSLAAGWFYRVWDQLLLVRLPGSGLPSTVLVQPGSAR